jgi:hypothetical protein
MLHGQQIVAGRDAGAAIHDGLGRVATVQQVTNSFAERGGRQYRPVIGKIRFEEAVGCAGDVPGSPIDRLRASFSSTATLS